ncbi:MAG TPA: GMC family oxidoreductase, partial [bacterium]
MTRTIHNGATLDKDLTLACDVVVIGTGAGGATTAEILSQSGLKVVMLEEGAYRTAQDFTLNESETYASLYQDGASRTTKDGAITILQGRTVGGSTTVNWTATFRTPDPVLKHWASAHGVKGMSPEEMSPWFARAEKRLHVERWALPPNLNNDVLAKGCEKLGWKWGVMDRNVNRCRNTGYCGMGCPTNAKQSMLVTSVPAALDAGAVLVTRCRAERLTLTGGKATGVEAVALDAKGSGLTGRKVTVQARAVVAAGGAINTPGLLLRSKVPDPNSRLGKRTFIHIVSASTAFMPSVVDGFYGAPQSIYSDQFTFRDGVTGKVGYKLEAAPVYPMQAMSLAGRSGLPYLQRISKDVRRAQALIALMRDGFNDESPGGTIGLRGDGSPVLDYQVTPYLWEGLFDAYLKMAEIQFAAGAQEVAPIHAESRPYKTWAEAQAEIPKLPRKLVSMGLFTAHLMGGCGMGDDPKSAVVNSEGHHHQVEGLWVIDGSVFPTSLGVNPQMSIYGMAGRNATR